METFGLEKIRLFKKPEKSSSSSSGSLYLGLRKFKDFIYILEFLPKNSETSEHLHHKLSEEYEILCGGCDIQIDGKKKVLKSGDVAIV